MGNTTYPEVRSEFEARHQRGDFLSVESTKYASEPQLHHAGNHRRRTSEHRHSLRTATPLSRSCPLEQAQQQARSRDFLNDSQRRVIEEVLNSTDRIHGLQGRAGTGKTSVLAASVKVLKRTATPSKVSPPRPARRRSFAKPESTLAPCRASLRKAKPPRGNPNRATFICWTNRVSRAPARCVISSRSWSRNDRVLVIGDTGQHQGVDAGRPFQQMQDAGMRTSQLDRIMRQKDPELLKAVEQLAKNKTQQGIDMLASQGRITEIPDRRERIAAIARDYAAQPENTIVVSPDNQSRQEINEAVRAELLQKAHWNEMARLSAP